MKTNKQNPFLRNMAIALVGLFAATPSQAVVYYWDNNGNASGYGTAGGTWAAPTVSQWSSGTGATDGTATPGASVTTLSTNGTTDSVNFGNGATGLAEGTITVSTVNTGNMTFASGSGAITLSGGTITQAATQIITVNNTSNTISSILAGAGTSLTKAGTGRLILTAANTYAGTTIVTAGTLQIDGSNTNAAGGSTNRLQVGASSSTNGTVIVSAGAGTLTFNGDGYANANQIGINGGTGALTINGGTVNLAGTTSTSPSSLHIGVQVATAAGNGTVTVNNGTLNIGQRVLLAANNTASTGSFTIAGGTVNVGYNGTLGYTGNNPGIVQFGTGTGTLDLDGGMLNLFGFKSHGGGTSTIRFNGGTLVALGSPAFFMGNNGSADAAPTANGVFTTVVKNGGVRVNTNGFNISIPTNLVFDPLSTGGGLTKSGDGTLTLSGANTFTGPTLVTGGSLQLNGQAAGMASTSGITMTGSSTLGFSAGAASTLNLAGKPFSFGGTLVFDISGPGVNDMITAGDVTLSANTNLTFNPIGAVATGTTYTVVTSTNPIVNGGFSLTGQTIGKLSLTPTLNANSITVAATLDEGVWNQPSGGDWSNAGNWTNYVPTFAGDAALFGSAITGPATIILDNPQTIGFLRIDNMNTVTLGNGGDNLTLDNDTLPAIVGVTSGSHVIAENIFLATNAFMGPAAGTTLTISGNISGFGKSLQLTDSGVLVIAGANNTYTGGTMINTGTLRLSGTGTLGSATTPVTVNSGGLLDLNGTNQSILFSTPTTSAGTVANNLANSTSILTMSAAIGSHVIIRDNTNSSTGKVAVVISASTNQMNNANTYSGGTTVNGGAFLYLTSSTPLGAGSGPITLTAPGTGAASNTGSGLVVDSVTYANDITGAGYLHANSSSTNSVTFTGNLTNTGPYIWRGGTVSNNTFTFAGNGTTSALSGVIGSATSQVNGAVNTGNIVKSGTGELTLSGVNVYTGSTTVSNGKLNLTGARTAAAGGFVVGNENGRTGELNISNGTFQTGTISVGQGNGTAIGVVKQTGGTLTLTGNQLLLGNGGISGALAGNGGNGTYELSGGTLTATSVSNRGVILGTNDGGTSTFTLNGTGTLTLTGALSQLMVGRADSAVVNTTNVYNQSAGTATVTTLSIGGAAAAATGLSSTFTVTGGTFSATNFSSLGAGDSGLVTMNIGGNAVVTLPLFPKAAGNGTTINLNFDGGTLRPRASSTSYMQADTFTNARLTANGAIIDTNNFNITVAQALQNAPSQAGTLTKRGAGILTLAGANTYTGNTVVSEGALVLAEGAKLKFVLDATSGSSNSISGAGTVTLNGSFEIDTSAADALSSGSWTLENVGSLTGAYGSTFSVAGFTHAGNDKWTKTVGSNTYTFVETTGVLTLAISDYSTWASTNGAGSNLNDDHDNDGVPNGIEYFIGGPVGNTTGFTPLPNVTNNGGTLSITWTKAATYTGSYGSHFVVETSDTLSNPWVAETSPGTVTISGNNVTYTFPAPLGTRKFVRLKVTGP